jgi:uncharacterized membrane protein YgcG
VAEAAPQRRINRGQPVAIAMATAIAVMATATVAVMGTAMAAMATTTAAVAAMVTAIVAMGTATATVVDSDGRDNGGNNDSGGRDKDNGGNSDGGGHRQQSTKRGSGSDGSCGDGRQWTGKARKFGWQTTMGKERW